MTKPILHKDRQELLADIAEMYFLQGKNQAEISDVVGVTRSNISRMLSEARQAGIVEISINRPIKEDKAVAQKFLDRFGLLNARVVQVEQKSERLETLGRIAAHELVQYLQPGSTLGSSWGTAINATVEKISLENPIPQLRVTQLLGAFGARIKEYDGHAIVRRLEEKLDAEGIYINAPFLVENKKIAASLMENQSISESLDISKQADIALLGVGSSEPEFCSYYLANYVSYDEIVSIQKAGAIGDVCGRFYSMQGKNVAVNFQERLIGISREDLQRIPIRIGVAGGPEKVKPIIGALRAGLINILVSDSATIFEVLNQGQ